MRSRPTCGVALWPLVNSEKQVKIATMISMYMYVIFHTPMFCTVLLELKQVDVNHYGSISRTSYMICIIIIVVYCLLYTQT